MKPYGSKRSFDTEPRIKSGRALVKREGEALVEEQISGTPVNQPQRRLMDLLAGGSIYLGQCVAAEGEANGVEPAMYAAEFNLISEIYQDVGREESMTPDQVENIMQALTQLVRNGAVP